MDQVHVRPILQPGSLANRDGLKVAGIVNEMSEVNVDAQLMKNGSASLSRVDERLVGMQKG